MRSRQCAAVCVACSVVALVSCEGPRGPVGPTGPSGPQGPPGTVLDWAEATGRVAPYTYLVHIVALDESGNTVATRAGTGFAISPVHIATAGSIALATSELAASPDVAQVATRLVPNGTAVTDSTTRTVQGTEGILVHPRYDVGGEGPLTPDVAVYTISQPVGGQVSLADSTAVSKVQAGQPLATVGFPNALGDLYPDALTHPTAVLSAGVCSAVRIRRNSDNNPTLLVNADLNAGPGSIGGPVFLIGGTVVGVLNALTGEQAGGIVLQAVGANHIHELVTASALGGRLEGWITLDEYIAQARAW